MVFLDKRDSLPKPELLIVKELMIIDILIIF